MSDFEAKMHQIQFRLGLGHIPCWGTYNAPPDLVAGFKGLDLRERRQWEGKMRWEGGKERGKPGGGEKGMREEKEVAPMETKPP